MFVDSAPEGPLELRMEHRAAPSPPPLRLRLQVEEGPPPRARFACEDRGPPDPLRERALALVRHTAAPVPTVALRAALGVRKHTLLALLGRLAGEGVIQRAGRDGWTIPPRAVPDEHAIEGTGPLRWAE